MTQALNSDGAFAGGPANPSRRPIRLVAVLVAAAVLLTGCAGGSADTTRSTRNTDRNFEEPVKYEAGSTMAAIQERGKLLVGIRNDAPPFSSMEATTGSWSGFDVEIAKQVAVALFGSRTEGHIEFVPLDPRDRELALEQRRVDIAMGRYDITAARKRFVDFAGPYYIAQQEIVVSGRQSGVNAIQSTIDLNGRKICVVPTSTNIAVLRQVVPQADVSVQRATIEECGAALARGEVQAFAGDHVDMLRTLNAAGSQFKVLPGSFATEPYGIGVNKQHLDLRSAINDRLEKISPNYPKIYDAAIQGDRTAPKAPPVDRY